MEITGDPLPWPQLSNSMPRRRSPSSPLLSPPVLIILLPIIALILLFFAVPPFVSMATQIFRPYGVRKSWDSLNILLVLFAILCGVFARRNDDEDNNNNNAAGDGVENVRSENVKAGAGSQQWFEYPERKIYGEGGLRRLKRNSSSYPDLRQESLWENNEDRFRVFDDFEIHKYRSSNYNHPVHELRRTRSDFSEESEAKVIHVDNVVLSSPPLSAPSKSPATSTPPPPPPPPPAARHKPRRTYQAVGQRENDNTIYSPPVTPPTPPPPPPRRPPSPLVQMHRSEQKHVKLERRKSNATKEIKMVFASLRKRKKKTKTKNQDYHHHDCPLHSPGEPTHYYSTTIPPPSPAPPPPPPPPPPHSVFQKYNLFKKSSKNKKIHSVPAPPPPPPPPPAFSLPKQSPNQNTQIPPTPPPAPPPPFFSTKRLTRQKSRIPSPPKPPRLRTAILTGKPPLPTKPNTSYYDENLNSGGQSPLIPMPPAPPPPPFKMPEFKFIFRGDFVKIRSNSSSRCSSPDLEEVDASSTKDDNIDTETASMDDKVDGDVAGVAGGVPVFCPSPDVNAKADTFIARLRDGWKLEKINSLKEKRRLTA